MRTNKKKAFLMYLDSLEPVYMMDDKQKAGLLNAIVAYQFEDNEMLEEAKKDQVVNIVFSRIEKYFKENEGAYEQTCLQNQANGRKGGNPNFKKGQSNPYYKKDNRGITEDNRPVMSGNEKITEDNREITEDYLIMIMIMIMKSYLLTQITLKKKIFLLMRKMKESNFLSISSPRNF